MSQERLIQFYPKNQGAPTEYSENEFYENEVRTTKHEAIYKIGAFLSRMNYQQIQKIDRFQAIDYRSSPFFYDPFTTYPTRSQLVGKLQCFFVSFYFNGQLPIFTIGQNTLSLTFLMIFGVFFFSMLLSMIIPLILREEHEMHYSILFLAHMILISVNIYYYIQTIMGNNGIPHSIFYMATQERYPQISGYDVKVQKEEFDRQVFDRCVSEIQAESVSKNTYLFYKRQLENHLYCRVCRIAKPSFFQKQQYQVLNEDRDILKPKQKNNKQERQHETPGFMLNNRDDHYTKIDNSDLIEKEQQQTNISDFHTLMGIPPINEEEKLPIEHCMNCDVCVEELDHHQVFFGKCIGKNNIFSFYMIMALFVVNSLFCAISSIILGETIQ